MHYVIEFQYRHSDVIKIQYMRSDVIRMQYMHDDVIEVQYMHSDTSGFNILIILTVTLLRSNFWAMTS